jgi:uncharacterized integral membrane protein (TIGR00697 family)
LDRKQRFFVFLTALFVAALVTGDFIGGKFFVVFGHTFSAGIVPFPLTFVLTDVVNEFYGTHGARRLTYAGLAAAIFVMVIIKLAVSLPTSPDSPIPDGAFQSVFNTSFRLYFASLCAYLVGQLLDIAIFHAFRRLTGHRFIWLRSTGSTVLSQVIDSATVSFVFLFGVKPLRFIVVNAAHNYLGKLGMAILLTPLVYLGHGIFGRHFHLPERDTPATDAATEVVAP